MSDPEACPPTIYGPIEPYATFDDLDCGRCSGMDFTPEVAAVTADPDADPPVEEVVEVPSADMVLFRRNVMFASRRVFIATGGKFPGCLSTTWRPCASMVCCGRGDWMGLGPYSSTYGALSLIGWVSPCGCGDRCSCTSWDGVRLPFGPIRSVESVTIDGADFTDFQIDSKWLRRTDGERWPTCQDMSLANTEVGTWEIVYRHGIDIPPEAKPLIAAFACELSKRCKGDSCSLSNGYRRAVSNNTEYITIDPLDYRLKLLTGYIPLDDWIVAIMGNHARTRPRLAGRRMGRVVRP